MNPKRENLLLLSSDDDLGLVSTQMIFVSQKLGVGLGYDRVPF